MFYRKQRHDKRQKCWLRHAGELMMTEFKSFSSIQQQKKWGWKRKSAFLYLWTGLSSSILSTAFLRWKYISFLNFQKLWAASLSLWFVVGVHYLSPCRWWRLFLSRRMAAASVFQTLLSGNPLNWIFTRLMFPVCAGAPQAPFSPRRTDLSLHKPDLSENNTKIDYAFRGNEWTAKPWMSKKGCSGNYANHFHFI